MPTLRFGLCKIDHGIEERSFIGEGKAFTLLAFRGTDVRLFIVRKQNLVFTSMNWPQI